MLTTMFRHSRLQNWLLALLCVALLLGRVGDAHLHLCFDGMEPPSSVHLFDFGVHHAEPDLETSHVDVDVAIAGDLLSKSKFKWHLLLALLVAIVMPGLRRKAHQTGVPFGSRFHPASPPYLRPPLRGPPLLTSC